MAEKEIHKKEWMVLEHFILNESKKIEETLKKYNKITSENIDHFSTYPGEIESKKVVNRVTAGKACKQFCDEKMSIFEIPTTDYTHRQGPKSKYYSLKTDLPTIRKLVKLILESHPYSEAKKLLDNYYFTYNLNESLIREVLCEKDVTISRYISVIDLDINEAQNIKDLFERNTGNKDGRNDKKDISSLIEENIKEYEKNNKEVESRYLDSLKNFCKNLNEDLENNDFNGKEYYFADYDLYNISKSRYYNFKIYSNPLNVIVVDPISLFYLRLPVFSEKFSENKNIQKIKELNLDTFYYMYYGKSYISPNVFLIYLKSDISSIISHLYELDKFLMYNPSDLSSLRKFINILEDFINQIDSKYYQHCTYLNFDELKKDIDDLHKQIIEYLCSIKHTKIKFNIDHKLNHIERQFEYIYKNIDECKSKKLNNDYIRNNFSSILQEHYSVFEYNQLILPIQALIQSSPIALNEFLNGDWDSFDLTFSPQPKVKNSKFLTKLIHIAFIDFMCMPDVFEKGIVESISFNSYCPPSINYSESIKIENPRKCAEYRNKLLDEYYNELSYDELKIIEGTPFKMKLKHLYELTFYLSFTSNTKGDNQKISSSLLLDIIPDIELYLFRIRELKNINSIISKLKKTDNTIYNHIRKLLSNKMQNIILHYDLSLQPSIRLKQELLEELNLVILKPELYRKDVFNELAKCNDKLKESIEMISTIYLSFKDLIQMVHEPSSYKLSTEILNNNKRVLQKVFADEFELD